MLHVASRVTGTILWANLHLLFWLSLIALTTGWMGENHFAPAPCAVYGVVLLMCGIAYHLLQQLIIRSQGKDSILREAIGKDLTGRLSIALYVIGVGCAFWSPRLAQGLYAPMALFWLIPDRRIERVSST